VHVKKQESEMISTEAGMEIVFNDEHARNALASIRVSLDPYAKVNDERDLQPWKQPKQMTTTDAGIEIDCNDEQPENVLGPSSSSCEPGSNVTAESN
jgi:hypothetical protein